ncbi:MAG: ATP-binding cassette, subfamily bacterial [Pseudonocardia sp.]
MEIRSRDGGPRGREAGACPADRGRRHRHALVGAGLRVGAAAARGLLDAAVAGVSGALVPRVEQRAQDMLHASVIEVELTAAARLSGTDTVVADLPAGWATVLSRMFQTGRDLSGRAVAAAVGGTRAVPGRACGGGRRADRRPRRPCRARRLRHAARARGPGRTASRCSSPTGWRTSRHADQILVLEWGRLIEHGRHEQLIALGGTYHELFTLQARAYGESAGEPDTVPA